MIKTYPLQIPFEVWKRWKDAAYKNDITLKDLIMQATEKEVEKIKRGE